MLPGLTRITPITFATSIAPPQPMPTMTPRSFDRATCTPESTERASGSLSTPVKMVTGTAPPSAQTVRASAFAKLAICNPLAAPYGAAAVETLQALDLAATLKPKLVEGANIAQAFQFVDSGNAELGFVALSQVVRKPAASYWLVPENLHRPILQEAVLLKAGAEAPAARAFLDFLKGPEARAIIARYGYGAQAP